ncbi:RNA recognition motif domain - like 10 [Theobroma cacao]|uniref:RNA-binding protein 38 n=1 Tax=Theobroma cacao TaxID=3641 RepID=A0AB32W3K5_THECC|nr:PREDICTED: RNA-binding protein 38 [Theobroma cacao]XP_017972150.1 PREDICTED: RNA-binding protein 38 [Theobroma cacao]WRX18768.1 RNA recognition motif domain - like 10 [Theobroma cacao]
MAGENNATGFGDTTYTKIFVGGLAWETKRDALKRYFEQFGEILEAVVINDKTTGRSKGYGFVTFKDADSAMRACHNPFPVIDGRRANCNLASLGAQKNRPTSASQHGMEKFSPPPRVMAPPSTGTPAVYRQIIPQYAFPYSAYGYPGYTQDIYLMNYYNAYGGQQLPSHFTTGSSGSHGVYLSYFPLYHQQGQGSPTQYPKITQYPYPSPPYRAFGSLTLPPAASPSPLAPTAAPATAESAGMPGTASAQNSSV